MNKSILGANIVRMLMASLSLTASSTIVHSIRHSFKGLKSPYSRIIYGLSIGDIIQSSAIIINPFVIPKGTVDSDMAIGNTATCDLAGFLIFLGIALTVFYLLFLIYYFFKRVRYHISPSNFAKGEEKYWHVIGLILAFMVPTFALVKKDFNPAKMEGAGCMLNSFPDGCGQGDVTSDEYVECTRGQGYETTSMAFGAIIGVALFIIFILLGSITWHVYSIEKSLAASSVLSQGESQNNENYQDDNAEVNANNITNKKTTPKKKTSLTRNAVQQSLLYIVAFIITYAAPFISVSRVKVMDSNIGIFILWLNSTIFPIFGIFLILIYTRPKVQILQKKFPKASWFLCFSVVLGSGGDVPPAHELEPSHLPIMSGEGLGMDSRRALTMSGVDDVSYEEMKSSMISLCQDEAWSHVSDISDAFSE